MQKRIKSLALVIALGLTLGSSLALGQDAEKRLDVAYKDVEFSLALRAITKETGLQFIFKSQKKWNVITLDLKDVPADDAIRYLCDAAGAYVVRDDNGVYIIHSEKPMAAVATSAYATPTAPAKIFKKITLLHQGAEAIHSQIVNGVALDSMGDYEKILRLMSISKRPVLPVGNQSNDMMSQMNQSMRFNPVKNAPLQNTPATNGAIGIDGGNGITLPGESANQGGTGVEGGGGGGGRGNQGGGQGGNQGGGQGGNQGGGRGGGGTLTGGTGLVPDTITFISFDPTDNSLIVQGTSEDDINRLQNIIAQFDIAPKQVSIKVEFVTTTYNIDSSLGYNVEYARGATVVDISARDFIRAADPVAFTYASGDAVFRLRTRLSEGFGTVTTAPIIRTLNNTPATVSAFTQDYVLFTTNIVTQQGILTTVNPNPIQVGTFLSVTPRINNDGYITMGLSPQVGVISGVRSVTISNTQTIELPVISNQSMFVVARVKDGDTIVLGGLNGDTSTTTLNRVPILGDLPIIGQFFRRQAKNRTSSELLIFVTPKIIEDDASGLNP